MLTIFKEICFSPPASIEQGTELHAFLDHYMLDVFTGKIIPPQEKVYEEDGEYALPLNYLDNFANHFIMRVSNGKALFEKEVNPAGEKNKRRVLLNNKGQEIQTRRKVIASLDVSSEDSQHIGIAIRDRRGNLQLESFIFCYRRRF